MTITSHTVEPGIVAVTVDYPPVNAIPSQGWFDLADTITAAGRDTATHVVILRAEGRVNAVVVGMVATEQAELFYGDSDSQAAVAATIPLGRLAQPSDIGWATAFLASDAASYISGATLAVHGGGEPPPYLSASSANK